MVLRLTPDQKVVCSLCVQITSGSVNFFLPVSKFFLFFDYKSVKIVLYSACLLVFRYAVHGFIAHLLYAVVMHTLLQPLLQLLSVDTLVTKPLTHSGQV